MDEAQLESQSRLLIELGEPETWLETMLRASRRSAEHEASIGNEGLAGRWRRLIKGLEYAIAATVNDPISDAIQDAHDTGHGFLKDGKRIAPDEVYKGSEPPDSTA